MDIRPIAIEDAAAIGDLIRRWETFWDVPRTTTTHEVEDGLRGPHVILPQDTIGYWVNQKLVAYGAVWYQPSGVRLERAIIEGYVDPDRRGGGLGRQLIAWQMSRATGLLQSAENQLPKLIRTYEWDWIDESFRLYRRFGLEQVRYFSEMLKPLTGHVEVEPIEGIQIVPYERKRDKEVLDAVNRAFEDHWETIPVDPVSFEHRLSRHSVRLDTSFLAIADGGVVGFVLNSHHPEDAELLGRLDGWVDSLGVVREWRKKGVATSLLKTSFNAFVDCGFTHTAIGVDTANPTNAHRLYSNVGYEPTHRTIACQIEIGGPGAQGNTTKG